MRRDGVPRHVYVVDGNTAIDAYGPHPLHLARAGVADFQQVSPQELLAELAAVPNGETLVAMIQLPELREPASRTASFIIETCRVE